MPVARQKDYFACKPAAIRHPVVVESSVSRDDRRSEHGGDGLRRSRLKGGEGARVWTGWAVLTYNVETYGLYT